MLCCLYEVDGEDEIRWLRKKEKKRKKENRACLDCWMDQREREKERKEKIFF